MTVRAYINQKFQVGVETTPGTSVAAGKELNCFSFTLGTEAETQFYGGTGQKYDEVQEVNKEWSGGSMDGNMDYNGLVYPLSSIFGATTPVAAGSSTTAKNWPFTPPVSGLASPKTFTFEQGDSTRAHKVSYGLFTQWGYKGTRKDFTTSGKFVSQQLNDNITLTAAPTGISLAPMVAKHYNIYMDTTSAGIGTTQLLKVLSVEYNFDNVFSAAWFINRSSASFSDHTDLKPSSKFKFKVEGDGVGMGIYTPWRDGDTRYIRVEAVGKVIDNLQTVSLGSPSAGTFTLTYKGQTTSAIAYNAAASAVQSALIALSTVGTGNVTVSGSAGGPYNVSFTGTLAQDTTAMTGSGAGLTGGTFVITQAQVYNTLKHDMAVKFDKPKEFEDDEGIFAVEWEGVVVKDASWNSGQAQTLTLTNLLTAL